ncbi:hypothetical protein [Sanguibacteroides sp. AM78-02pH3A]|uniref:hypothetical protein n=1 Tax=Sanguibacteroides sp. AM78-02pH3A TaxID=3002646 RepID=UPI0022E15650|nr:hypothetical protein [Sanguibacteroides sp. AM78-02pH3A]
MEAKFYKEKIIDLMTLLFGPFSGGLLMSINFFHMGRRKAAWFTLLISLLLTLVIVLVLCSLPDEQADRVPRYLIPGLSVIIIGFVVYKTQKRRLDEHAREGGTFYSAWRALGVSLVGLSVLLLLLVATLFFTDIGNVWPEELDLNEEKALKVYEMIEREEDPEIVRAYVDTVSLVCWKKYQDALRTIERSKDLGKENRLELTYLKKYVELRLQECSQMLIWLENPLLRDEELNRIQEEIDKILSEYRQKMLGE